MAGALPVPGTLGVAVNKTARNVLIVVALAAAVAFLPGGGGTANAIWALLSIAILVTFVLLGVRFYRENRVAIFSLGDKHRALAYGAIAAIIIAFAGRKELTETGPGSLVFVALIMGALGAGYAVFKHHREYGY
jgi:peptidoglycan/LPS O-acetylase OafA/YrhL